MIKEKLWCALCLVCFTYPIITNACCTNSDIDSGLTASPASVSHESEQSSTKITFTAPKATVASAKFYTVFATTSKTYTTTAGNFISSTTHADATTLSGESFMQPNPCENVAAATVSTDCITQYEDYVPSTCPTEQYGQRGATLRYKDAYKKVFVIVWSCKILQGTQVLSQTTKKTTASAITSAKVYGPYVLRKIGQIQWIDSSFAGKVLSGGDEISVQLSYTYPMVITGVVNLKYYKLAPSYSSESSCASSGSTTLKWIGSGCYKDMTIQLGELSKPNGDSDTATQSKTFLLSTASSISAGTYRIYAVASSVSAGSDTVAAFSSSFNIVPSLVVTPRSSSMVGGGNYRIDWTITNMGDVAMKLSLVDGNNAVKALFAQVEIGTCPANCNCMTSESGCYWITIPTSVSIGNGYKIKVTALSDPQTHSGFSSSVSILPSLKIERYSKAEFGPWADDTANYHGLDRMDIVWTATNDPANVEVWNVDFVLCQGGENPDCNLLQEPLTVTFASKISGQNEASATISIPASSAITPASNYRIQVRSLNYTEVTFISESKFEIVGSILISSPSSNTLVIYGDEYMTASFETRNLNQKIYFYICPNGVSSMADTDCVNIGEQEISQGQETVSIKIPSDSSLLHGHNAYKFGLKSSAHSTELFSSTLISVEGRIYIQKPVSNSVHYGKDSIDFVWEGKNIRAKLNVTLCRSTASVRQYEGHCVGLDTDLYNEASNASYQIPATSNVYAATRNYYMCARSVQYPSVVGCSPAFTIENMIIIDLSQQTFFAGQSVSITYEARNMQGNFMLDLCYPGKCMAINSDVFHQNSLQVSINETLTSGKETLYRTDYRFKATPKLRALDSAISYSDYFEIKPRIKLDFAINSQVPFRGGNDCSVDLVAFAVDANITLKLCWGTATPVCRDLRDSIQLSAAVSQTIYFTWPLSLALFRDDYYLSVITRGCSTELYQCALLNTFSQNFKIIVNKLPKLESASISPSIVYSRSSNGTLCVAGPVSDEDIEHNTFTFKYQWQQSLSGELEFQNITGETMQSLKMHWDNTAKHERNLRPGSRIRCIIVPKDEFDYGNVVYTAPISIQPLKIVVQSTKINLEGGDSFEDNKYECVFPFKRDQNFVKRTSLVVEGTLVACSIPEWDYPPGHVPVTVETIEGKLVSLTSPTFQFLTKVPRRPTFVGRLGRIEQTSTITMRWTPSKYADGSWEIFDTFELGANRTDAGATEGLIIRKLISPTWTTAQGPIDKNDDPTDVAIHDITGLLGKPATYRVAVREINSVGYSKWSEWSPAYAMEEAKRPSTPAQPQVSSVTTDSIDILFTEPDDHRGSYIVNFKIDVGYEDPGNGCGGTSWDPSSACSSTSTTMCCDKNSGVLSFTCKNLDPSKKYVFRVYAQNQATDSGGWSLPSVASSPPVQLNDQTYKVVVDATNGVDSISCTGTENASPCKSLSYAFSRVGVNKGQEIAVKPGHYVGNRLVVMGDDIIVNSTGGPDVTFINCDGESCFETGTNRTSLTFPKHIEGFTMYNAKQHSAIAIGVSKSDSSWRRVETAITIKNCVFLNNTLSDTTALNLVSGGAAISVLNAKSVIIQNSLLTANRAPLGGAIYIESSDVTLRTCILKDNTALKHGGAIYITTVTGFSRSVVEFEENSLTNNFANQKGGSLYLDSSDISAKKSSFLGNIALSSGGAIYFVSCNFQAATSIFENNTAGSAALSVAAYGGAINCLASKAVKIISSKFKRNQASSGSAADGGALYSIYCSIDFRNIEAIDNKASRSGGFAKLSGNSIVKAIDSEFVGNYAALNGGTIACFSCETSSRVSDSAFLYSSAIEGGAIALYETKEFKIVSSTFDGCNATGNSGGAALYVGEGAKTNQIAITQSAIRQCAANRGGGAILWVPSLPFTAPPVLIDGATKASASGNKAAYGSFLASTSFKVHFSETSKAAFAGTTSGAKFSSATKALVLDYYDQHVVTDSTSHMLVKASSNGIKMHKDLEVRQRASNGIVSLTGFAVFGYPGSNGSITFTNGVQETNVHVSIRLCLPGEYTDVLNKVCEYCGIGKFSNSTASLVCTLCSSGTYADSDGQTDCAACNAGTYGDEDGMSKCIVCDAGKYSNSRRSRQCSQCIAGFFASSEGSTGCLECDAGTYSSTAASNCIDCEVGKASAQIGAQSCPTCTLGTYMDEIGQRQCKSCKIGQHGADDENGIRICIRCGIGTYTEYVGQHACKQCNPGKYAARIGSSNCSTCLKGHATQDKGSSVCHECEPGRYASQDGATECQICRAGTVQPGGGKTLCLDCPAGKYSKDLSKPLVCTQCAEGWYNSYTASDSCMPVPQGFKSDKNFSNIIPCPPGTLSNGRTSYCSPVEPGYYQPYFNSSVAYECVLGTYAPLLGSAKCLDCPSGKYQPNSKSQACMPSTLGFATGVPQGAIAQIRCNAGTFSTGEATSCGDCLPGSHSYSGSAYCSVCEVGKFATLPRSKNCISCPKGTWAPESNSTTCEFCPPGRFGSGFEACSNCPAGMFSDVAGSSTCKACQEGEISAVAGSTKCIKCPVGKYASVKKAVLCTDCDVNTFAPRTGSAGCTKCASKSWTENKMGQDLCVQCKNGEVFPEGATGECLKCRPESYSFIAGENIPKTCHTCPEGASCLGGSNVKNRVGFWRAHPHSNIMNRCLIPAACLGVKNLVLMHPLNEHALSQDHNITELCRFGHTGPICNSCRGGFGMSGRQCIECGNPAVEQSAAILKGAFMIVVLSGLVRSTMIKSKSIKRKPTTTILKILLSHFQILTLNSSYGVDWPPLVVYLLNAIDLFAYLDSLMPVDCALSKASYFERSATYLVFPIAYIPLGSILLIIILPRCSKIIDKQEKLTKTTSVVPITTDNTAKRDNKVNSLRPPDDKSKSQIKISDALKTSTGAKSTLSLANELFALSIISMLILYPSLTKRTLSLVVCRHIFLYDENSGKDVGTWLLAADTSIQCYTDNHNKWQALLAVPAIILYVIGIPAVLLYCLWKNRSEIYQPRLIDINMKVRATLGFVFRSYEADWFWWEIVRIIRKTVMIFIALYFRSLGKTNHMLLSIGVMAFNFAIHQHAMPFQNVDLDNLEKYALVCQFLTLYSGLYFNTKTISPIVVDILSYIILSVNVGFVLLCCRVIYISSDKKCCRAKEKKKLNKVITKNMSKIKSKFLLRNMLGEMPVLLPSKCAFCGRSDPRRQVMLCGNCSQRAYCSISCQKADWFKNKHMNSCTGGKSANLKTTQSIAM